MFAIAIAHPGLLAAGIVVPMLLAGFICNVRSWYIVRTTIDQMKRK